ncbi:MAG: hypothetical protein WDN06_01490 [Asticcacaulis sp.]
MKPPATTSSPNRCVVSKVRNPTSKGVRRRFQSLIEQVTSLRLADAERARLAQLSRPPDPQPRHGRDRRHTTHRGLSKVLMAAAANSPDMLNLIYAEA